MNKSESKMDYPMNVNVNYVLTCLFLIIAIIGILGNILVIISVRIDARMRRSLTNRLIVHVASCDLIILLFNIPDIIQFVSSRNGNWVLSQIACKFIRTILVLAQYASVLTMCAITIERFIGIVYPLRSKFLREKKHVAQITFIVWIFSLLCASPNLIYLRVITMDPTRRSCHLQYSRRSFLEDKRGYIIHKSIESTIFYFIPLLLQIYCNIRIARQLYYIDDSLQTSFILIKKQTNQRSQDNLDDYDEDFIDNDGKTGSKYSIADSFVNSSNGLDQNSSRRANSLAAKFLPIFNNSPISITKTRQRTKDNYHQKVAYDALKSRRSVIKMLSVVVLIYFVSFSPQVLIFVLFETKLIEHTPQFIQTPYFLAFAMLLVTISSASNPIVYAIFCSKFRQSFAKVLRRLCFCGRPTFTCDPNQRARSLQQIPRATYHFQGKTINGEKRQTMTNQTCIHLKDTEGERR